MNKVGRPGKRRATHGRIRAAIPPELKEEIEALVVDDKRFRSFAFFIETALIYLLKDYRAAEGDLDKDLFPRLKKR